MFIACEIERDMYLACSGLKLQDICGACSSIYHKNSFMRIVSNSIQGIHQLHSSSFKLPIFLQVKHQFQIQVRDIHFKFSRIQDLQQSHHCYLKVNLNIFYKTPSLKIQITNHNVTKGRNNTKIPKECNFLHLQVFTKHFRPLFINFLYRPICSYM